HIASILKHGDMSGKAGSSLILYNVPGIKIPKILLIGLGKEKELDGKKYHAAVRAMIYALKKMDVKTITSLLQIATIKEADIAWNVEHFVNEVMDASYEFGELKTDNKENLMLIFLSSIFPSCLTSSIINEGEGNCLIL
ncbi:MAG: hypothetical protein EBS33_05270, partial [Alphaproteobacteria bacterium]|nr:hypothetical protein [Alphaproteobacteria bacterium]